MEIFPYPRTEWNPSTKSVGLFIGASAPPTSRKHHSKIDGFRNTWNPYLRATKKWATIRSSIQQKKNKKKTHATRNGVWQKKIIRKLWSEWGKWNDSAWFVTSKIDKLLVVGRRVKQISNKKGNKIRNKKRNRQQPMHRSHTLLHTHTSAQLITFASRTLYIFDSLFPSLNGVLNGIFEHCHLKRYRREAPQINHIFFHVFFCPSSVVSWLLPAIHIGRVFRDYKMLYILWNNQFFSTFCISFGLKNRKRINDDDDDERKKMPSIHPATIFVTQQKMCLTTHIERVVKVAR